MIKRILYSNMTLSLQLNVYFNSLKLGDMLYIKKVFILNSVVLLKQKEIHKSKSKISPIAE
jgi:hypothetical protein